MELRLHKNARTTPAVRAEIAASTEGVSALARRRVTVRKWKHRTDPMDRSHTAHLQTTMNSGQECDNVGELGVWVHNRDWARWEDWIGPILTPDILARWTRTVRGILPFLAALSGSVIAHAEPPRPSDCATAVPPADAGVMPLHGIYFFVFPRHVVLDLAENYTGCQSLLSEDGVLRWDLHFENGRIRASMMRDDTGTRWCDYEHQTPSEAAGDCHLELGEEWCGEGSAEHQPLMEPAKECRSSPFFRSDPLSKFPAAQEKLGRLRERLESP
jgi:hypothetical protein